MRLLFVIPHYFRADPDAAKPDLLGNHGSVGSKAATRLLAIRRTVLSLHQTFGRSQAVIRIADRQTMPANHELNHEVRVVMVTTGDSHLMEQAKFLPRHCVHAEVETDPIHLGFRAHAILRNHLDEFDYFCYLEDDLLIRDPYFFEKLQWFNHQAGHDKVLLPNRYERGENLAYDKCYVDGDLAARVTEPFQDTRDKPQLQGRVLGKPVRFVRPLNPHSGCFFLNAEQMQTWVAQSHFGVPAKEFIGPLESAATLGVMKTFRIYKPAMENAGFLEIEHFGSQFLRRIRLY